jgi:hypothetical protein
MHSKDRGTVAHVKSSLHCRTFNCQLNSLYSSNICQLPTANCQLPTLLTYLRRAQLSTANFQLTLNITTSRGQKRKYRFQQYSCCCVFTDPLLRNGFSYFACMFVSAGTCLLSRCLAMNCSGFQASCHSIYAFVTCGYLGNTLLLLLFSRTA